MSNSVRPHRWQPTRPHCPWDSPGKNTGVGCHFLLQCTEVKSESEVAKSCLTLSDPMDCSLPGSSVHGRSIFISSVHFLGKSTGVGCHCLLRYIAQGTVFSTLYSLYRKRILTRFKFSSVAQSCQLFATPWTVASQASLSITNFWSLLKFMFINLVMPPNNLIFCLPLYLLPLIFPSIRDFSDKSVLPIRWPKYWRLSFSIGPSNEYSGLISFRVDWLDLLAVQGTLNSLVQHRSLKASMLLCSAFFRSSSHIHHNFWQNHSFEYTNLCW